MATDSRAKPELRKPSVALHRSPPTRLACIGAQNLTSLGLLTKEAAVTSDKNARITDLPEPDRPRERLVALGPDRLSNAELIAILLRTGLAGMSALRIAEQALRRFGTLQEMAAASLEELCQIRGIGRDKAVALKAAFTLARNMAREIRNEAPLLDTPDRVADLLREENRLL